MESLWKVTTFWSNGQPHCEHHALCFQFCCIWLSLTASGCVSWSSLNSILYILCFKVLTTILLMTALFYSIKVIMGLILNLVTPKTMWNKFIPEMVSILRLHNRDQTLLHKGTKQANPWESKSAVHAPLGRLLCCVDTLGSSVWNGKKKESAVKC